MESSPRVCCSSHLFLADFVVLADLTFIHKACGIYLYISLFHCSVITLRVKCVDRTTGTAVRSDIV